MFGRSRVFGYEDRRRLTSMVEGSGDAAGQD